MTKNEVEVGKTYAVKVSGKIAPVKLTGVSTYGGWDAVNTATNRTVRIRSAAKLRRVWLDPRCGVCTPCLQLIADRKLFAERYRVAVDSSNLDEALRLRVAWRDRCGSNACTKGVTK